MIFAGIFGNILPPSSSKYFTSGTKGEGLFLLLSNLFKLITTIAGIFLIFQLLISGFQFISANGDSKKIEQAWAKIWQSLLGLVIVASAFALAALAERFTGLKIINPEIYGP
jgi:uncharacterized membrane protein